MAMRAPKCSNAAAATSGEDLSRSCTALAEDVSSFGAAIAGPNIAVSAPRFDEAPVGSIDEGQSDGVGHDRCRVASATIVRSVARPQSSVG